MDTHAHHETKHKHDSAISHHTDYCTCCRVCELAAPKSEHDEHDEHAGHEGHGEYQEHAGHEDHTGHHDHTGHEIMFRNRFWICLVLSIPVIIYSPAIQNWFSYTAPVFPGSQWILPVLATVVFVYGGLPFLRMSRWELRDRKPGMMTLISLAISVAYFYSMATLIWDIGEDFFWELVTLIDIMLLGHWMEMRSVRQASGALDALAKLMPDTAEVILPDGNVMEHSVSSLKTGDLVLIRPGANAPADGVVVEGESDMNESMLTGESRPVKKSIESQIIAGTVNSGNGSLRARLTAVGDDTALSGIMRLVQEAQQSKSETQLLADRAASWLFYAAVAVALLAGIIWSFYFGGITEQVIATVVTVLVIACPHALGLAVPLVVANTTSLGANNGILIRDRQAMETAKDLNIITFDKTGTLTKGEVGVVGMATNDRVEADEALAITAAIEGDSEHPIAQAIRQAAEEKQLNLPQISEFQILKGRGVQAIYDGAPVYVGGPRLLEYLEAERPSKLTQFAEEAGNKGQSVIYLVSDDIVVAAFALADVIREESGTAVRALHEQNVEVAMLTGDSQDVAKAVADELKIDKYFAEVLPADKDKKVIELQKAGQRVGMVGDGVNDAPALTRADIGIAIGSGTDVAVQSAGLILVKSNPLDVVKILKLSQASYRKQTQNIWWGAGYNIVMIPLAAGILAPLGFIMPPALGAFLMSISTIIVAINAQTLMRTNLDAR
ncbi:MAG: heavy metal translocating P-type ATPase [Chloroflexi bacterium]|jgi:Cu2+-exporting ATPase|nr:heavy metal translocating P-type ATPase [Chloroflexota bacterium]